MGHTRNISIFSLNAHGIKELTRRRALFTYLDIKRYDIVLLQETHVDSKELAEQFKRERAGKSYFSFGASRTGGVAVLIRDGLNCSVDYVKYGHESRSLIVDITIEGLALRIINVYCPNDSLERNNFLRDLDNKIQSTRTIVLAGDFNFVEDPRLDRQGGNPDRTDSSRPVMAALTSMGDLVDIFRAKRPTDREFTFYDHIWQSRSRLDRIYISRQDLDRVGDIDHIDTLTSDHLGVLTNLKFHPRAKHSLGYWKCNVSVLQDEYLIADIESAWADMLTTTASESRDLEWWDECKTRFKETIISHSVRLAAIRRERHRALEDRLADLEQAARDARVDQSSSDTRDELRTELQSFLEYEAEGTRIRSRALYLSSTDKCTKEFLSAEKGNAARRDLSALKLNGTVVTDQSRISDACTAFYRDLFTAEAVDVNAFNTLFRDIPVLTRPSADLCEGLLSYDEAWQAVRQMKTGTSPRADGLPRSSFI